MIFRFLRIMKRGKVSTWATGFLEWGRMVLSRSILLVLLISFFLFFPVCELKRTKAPNSF